MKLDTKLMSLEAVVFSHCHYYHGGCAKLFKWRLCRNWMRRRDCVCRTLSQQYATFAEAFLSTAYK